jgi:hypothetical protein
VPPTELEVKKAAAEKEIDALQRRIDRIKQGKEPHLDANSREANGVIANLQRKIDLIKQGKAPVLDADTSAATAKLERLRQFMALLSTGVTVPIRTSGGFSYTPGAAPSTPGEVLPKKAGGGTVHGPGGPKTDSVPLWASDGEEVIQMPYAAHYRGLLKQINQGKVPAMSGARSAQQNGAPAPAAPHTAAAERVKPLNVHVFIGNEEIHNIARVEVLDEFDYRDSRSG